MGDERHDRRSPPALVRIGVYALFLAMSFAALWVPYYNRIEPALFGIPFFYWFQTGWVVVAAVATAVAYRLKV